MIADGKKLAEQILDKVKKDVTGKDLHLAAVLIQADEALRNFVDLKKKAAHRVGIQFSTYEFNDGQPQEEIIQTIKWLSDDPGVHGILIELPIPKTYQAQVILDAVAPAKDVDVLTMALQDKYYANQLAILPPAVQALKQLFEHYQVLPQDKNVVVFGQGILVGKPIAHWLTKQGAKVTAIDENTENPEKYSLTADIIVSGVGKWKLITKDMIKDDAVVVDFGYPSDVDFDVVAPKASLITPVPGGMGPLVVAAVLENLLKLSHAGHRQS